MQEVVVDGVGTIAATALRNATDAERDAYRGRLTCRDAACNAPAFYVRPSRSARLGHFASRQHMDDCTQRSTDPTEISVGDLQLDRQVLATATSLKVRFDHPNRHVHGRPATARGPAQNVGRQHQLTPSQTVDNAQQSMGLRRLLGLLAYGFGLPDDTLPLVLSDGTRGPFSDVVLHADDLANTVPSGLNLFWGRMVSNSQRSGRLWFNGGAVGTGLPSMSVPEGLLGDLLETYGVTNLGEIDRWFFICEAVARPKHGGGSVLEVSELRFLALLPPLPAP